MLTILLYLFHSRRPAEAHCGGGTGALPTLPTLRTFPLTTVSGAASREFFSALSSFKKSCFRISNNLLEGTLMAGMLFAVRELG